MVGDKLLSQIPPMPTPSLTDILYAINSAGTIQGQITVQQLVNLALPYKRYVALLTQTGTNAPVATVIENTLGGTVVWSRLTDGVYVATLAGAMTVDKTMVLTTINPSGDGFMQAARLDADSVILGSLHSVTGIAGDGILGGGPYKSSVEIRVYN
jgi:hypothetical protein